MPKSKRDKKVSLTKTTKKGLEGKQKIIEEIMECCDKYDNVFLLNYQNMRNNKLKEIRNEWKDSKFFFGKNNIMKLALGKTEINEKFVDTVEGQCGLLFTSHPKNIVVDWFESYVMDEFARSGFKANETIVLPQGPMPEFSHAIEPHLRKLGMPTKLDRGIVTLFSDYTVCKKGSVLTPEQAKILKLVGRPIAKFKITTEYCFTKENGFEVLKANPNSKKKSMKAKSKVKPKAKKPQSVGSDDESGEENCMEIVANSDDDDEDDDDDDNMDGSD